MVIQSEAAPLENETFEIRIKSTEMAVREALSELTSKLETYQCAPEETATVELVMAEVLNNIVEHAYPAEEPEGTIQMYCALEKDGLRMEIKDHGRPMPNGELPFGNAPKVDVDFADLPEGGFGWFLIKDLAKDLTYRRVDQTNLVSLRIAVGI